MVLLILNGDECKIFKIYNIKIICVKKHSGLPFF